MKAVPVLSVKGGVGKSTICAHLGLTLRDKSYRVGFLDCDVTGANLPSALGIPEPFPHVGIDTERQKMLAVNADGYQIFSLAFRFGRAALMWTGGEQRIEAFGQEFELNGTGRYELIRQMLQNVEFSELDYLLVDCPPGTGDEVLSLLEYLKDIWGVILVCQPTALAVQDIERALNMVEVKKLPVIGMVGNMVEVVCPDCGRHFSPYLDGGVDLEGFCGERRIPYLESVPFSPNGLIFDSLAKKVIETEPVKIWKKTFKQKLQEAAVDGTIKAIFGKGEI